MTFDPGDSSGAANSSPEADTDVLVVGAGPCGATLANLLGVYGVRVTIIDREVDILDFPRAVGIDDESLRTYQTLGLADLMTADMLQNMPIRYHNSRGKCFAHVKPSAKPYGWARRNLFLQPLFESTLRAGLQRHSAVAVQLGTELIALTQDDRGVVAQARAARTNDSDAAAAANERGQTDDPEAPTILRTIRCQYVVGADGGRSTVRRLTGVELTGSTAPNRWLVVDVGDDQLDAPYSAVYCHPKRPVLMVPLPYRHRRFEFKLQPGDRDDDMTEPTRVRELLAAQYGSTPLPRVVRARVYQHHSRIAETFQRGRVFLAGDAAHLQPPFFGQGMNSGIRDAANLAWKLAAVVSRNAAPSLLDTYDIERRATAAAMVRFVTRIGKMYTPRNTVTERGRDLAFAGLQLVPGGRDYILQMKYKPMPHYTDGVVAEGADSPIVGRMYPQPLLADGAGARRRLDDAVGPWFAVLGVHVDPRAHLAADTVAWWTAMGATFVQIDAARSAPRGESKATDDGLLRFEDVDGAFRDARLERPGEEIIVLRPDRYVAAACDRSRADATLRTLRALLEREPTAG